jgi:hypothetical protein
MIVMIGLMIVSLRPPKALSAAAVMMAMMEPRRAAFAARRDAAQLT